MLEDELIELNSRITAIELAELARTTPLGQSVSLTPDQMLFGPGLDQGLINGAGIAIDTLEKSVTSDFERVAKTTGLEEIALADIGI